jgi:hypothetical protein
MQQTKKLFIPTKNLLLDAVYNPAARHRKNILLDAGLHNTKDVTLTHTGMIIHYCTGGAKETMGGSSKFAIDHYGKLILKTDRKIIQVPKPVKKNAAAAILQPVQAPASPSIRNIDYTVNGKLVQARIASTLLAMPDPHLLFLTISFPCGIQDATATSILNVFLTIARKYKIFNDYVWVAERQQNGTIHYHIAIFKKFVNVQRCNRLVAGILKKYCKAGRVSYNYFLLKKYNGVDLAKDRKTKKITDFALRDNYKALGKYLAKYCTKRKDKDGKELPMATFKGRAWGCSQNISALMLTINLPAAKLNGSGIRNYINWEKEFQIPLRDKFGQVVFLECGLQENLAIFYPWLKDPPKLFEKILKVVNSTIFKMGAAASGTYFSYTFI